jgi:protein SCO1/2
MRFMLLVNMLMLLFAITGCVQQPEQPLPFLGQKQITEKIENGKTVTDTTAYQIPDFALVNQDSQLVNQSTMAGKIYVADFFFTSCPTICPKMKQQLLRVYEEFEENPDVLILSHTIDTRHDSVPVLKAYAEKLGVSSDKWHFLTGQKEEIYSLARAYMIPAEEDERAPGGYAHSGAFLLIDGNRHVRGVYDGTRAEDVDELIDDIKILLKHG